MYTHIGYYIFKYVYINIYMCEYTCICGSCRLADADLIIRPCAPPPCEDPWWSEIRCVTFYVLFQKLHPPIPSSKNHVTKSTVINEICEIVDIIEKMKNAGITSPRRFSIWIMSTYWSICILMFLYIAWKQGSTENYNIEYILRNTRAPRN